MKIAIIGAGKVGTTLGDGWAKAGHEVVYGSRKPQSSTAGAGGARVLGIAEAAQASEIVVLTTPWEGAREAAAAMGDLDGRVLVDATNPIGPGFGLAIGHTTSGAEEIARAATGGRVVKAFNTTGLENMADPRYGDSRALMPVAGDDTGAREAVLELARALGFEAVSVGPLSRARALEPLALVWIRLAIARGLGRGVAFGLARRSGAPEEAAAREAAEGKARRMITVVGAGNIGGALAHAWLRAGHDVRLAVRDASSEEVRALVAEGARAVPIAGAATGAEVVVLTTPAGVTLETARQLGELGGAIVIDCTNAIGAGLTLQHGHTTSWAERLAEALPGARVVKSFNQQGAETLRAPRFDGHLAALNLVAGDDAEARAVVAELSRDVGLDTIDAGPLEWARLLEPMTVAWIALSQSLRSREFGLVLLRR